MGEAVILISVVVWFYRRNREKQIEKLRLANITVSKDITERKNVEQKLRESYAGLEEKVRV